MHLFSHVFTLKLPVLSEENKHYY